MAWAEMGRVDLEEDGNVDVLENENHEGSDHGELRVVRAGRRQARRIAVGKRATERMLHLAPTLLPPTPRLIVQAYWEKGLTIRELAALHRTTERAMRRRVEHLRATLNDPIFLAAARYAASLPGELGKITRAHWLEGLSLRELATARKETLHQARQKITLARILLEFASKRPD